MRLFAPGETVVWRSILPRPLTVQSVWASTIVSDGDGEVVLYMPAGSGGKQRTGVRGGPRGRMLLEWDGGHRDVTWTATNVVRLHRDGDAYSFWLAFDPNTWQLAWRYVNLEEPWRRTPVGFDSRDLYLDLIASPERDDWRWKDEDELAWTIEQGRIDAARAAAIRVEGERALEHVRRDGSRLAERWSSWRPDPGWTPPAVPPRWRDHPTTGRS